MVNTTLSIPAVSDVLPGDEHAVNRVEGWFRQYVETRDPDIREQIIVSYLGLADRLAERYRTSRGASPEDLRQTARVGLVAAVDARRDHATVGQPWGALVMCWWQSPRVATRRISSP